MPCGLLYPRCNTITTAVPVKSSKCQTSNMNFKCLTLLLFAFQFSNLFTELPVPPQAAGVVGTFYVLLYIILNTTVSFLEDTILFLQLSFFPSFCVHFYIFASTLYMCVMYLTSFDRFF